MKRATIAIMLLRVDADEASANLLKYLEAVEQGDTVVICRCNERIAELRPISRSLVRPRPQGLQRDQFSVPATFFEPLPREWEDAFGSSDSWHASGNSRRRWPACASCS